VTTDAIPTWYRSTRFRSRLEARWAAVFDAFVWPWEYEPLDLRGYVPDFVLPFKRTEWTHRHTNLSMLVEVKPALSLDEMREACLKIDASGWEHEALVVGATLHLGGDVNTPVIGLLREHDEGEWRWGSAELFSCGRCERTSILHGEMSWRCRVCGYGVERGGSHDGTDHVGVFAGDLANVWGDAGATVQWMPRGGR